MTVISYTCPNCDEIYTVKKEIVTLKHSSIPSPGTSILKMQYQDHGDHTYFLEIDGVSNTVKNFRIIPHVRSVFDTLLYDNIGISRIVNTMLASKYPDQHRVILYITDLSSFKTFFAEITKKYCATDEDITIHYEPGFMYIGRKQIVLIICNLETGLSILKKGKKANDVLNRMGRDFEVKSLVIDTSVHENEQLLKKIKKSKAKLDSDLKTIIAFNTGKSKTPPLELREYLLDKHGLNSLELLNYNDTNGLKSIFLQSYYNVMENPYEVREVYEIVHNQHKPKL